MYVILLPLVIALYVFAYHYERNGNPLNWGNFFSRSFWAVSFSFGYAVMAMPDVTWSMSGLLILMSYLAMLVPHAWVQNMGRWGVPQKRWPGFLLPEVSLDTWNALPMWERTFHDFFGMACVGIIRGVIVFVPTLFLGSRLTGVLSATVLTAFWQPLAYLLGYYIPFKKWNNTPNSAEWGEFIVPIGWAVAVALLLWA